MEDKVSFRLSAIGIKDLQELGKFIANHIETGTQYKEEFQSALDKVNNAINNRLQ